MPFYSSVSGNLGPLGRSRKPKNFATGGTVTTFSSGGKNYRRHTFTTAGAISFNVVSNLDPFTVALIGAGGGGSAGYIAGIGVAGANGGGGGSFEASLNLATGSITGTVGAGGVGGAYSANCGNRGGSTTINAIAGTRTAGGGGGGNTEYSGSTGPGTGDGATGTGGTGQSVSQANGGTRTPVATFPGQTIRDAYSLGTAGNGGGGGGQDFGSGGTGVAGAIVITYEVD